MIDTFVGALVNSGLYLSAIVVVGLFRGDVIAVDAAVAAMGATYVSYLVQGFDQDKYASAAAVLLSIALGVAAGLALLIGI